MASATPSRTLPKSIHYRTAVSTASATSAPYVPDADSDPSAEEDTSAVDQSFSHPPHPVASHDYAQTTNLVIVCGHAIFAPDPSLSSFPLCSPYSESSWHLAPFQRSDSLSGKPGEHETFLAHIAAGLNTLTTGSWAGRSLLVLSGGPTKQNLTQFSEARSYYNAALAMCLAAGEKGGGFARRAFETGRLVLEEHATDSFQNLLFSILLFRRTTGRYPAQVRVITHAFKSRRFLDSHALAISWPAHRIRIHGINPVMSSKELTDTEEAEKRFGFEPWERDPLGVGHVLCEKRKIRGWNPKVLEEIGKGLEECVKDLLSGLEWKRSLPWEERKQTVFLGPGLVDDAKNPVMSSEEEDEEEKGSYTLQEVSKI